jgi:hypothetical protein
MRRFPYTIVFAFAHVLPSQAQTLSPYTPVTAEIIEKICGNQKSDKLCDSYFRGSVDAYLAQHRDCVAGDFVTFLSSVRTAVLYKISALDDSSKQQTWAPDVIAFTLAGMLQCDPVAPMPGITKPNPEACAAGLSYLNEEYVSSYQKQAVLEILRNKGCLE